MGLDAASDVVVAAVATLAKLGVNAELASSLGTDAIRTVFGHPRPLEFGLADTDMPALSVYRARQQSVRRGLRREQEIILGLDFVSPMRGHNKVAPRWDLLSMVWEHLIEILARGRHPAASSDAPLLQLVGVVATSMGDPTLDHEDVRYDYERTGAPGVAYPGFRGAFVLRVRPPADLSAFSDLLSVEVRYLNREDPAHPAGEQPIVHDRIPLHGSLVDSDEQTDDELDEDT
ncbi:MAG: hypothetical protein IT379_39440 [Deltaproteobacteria bacterium]|nr:hypothetical protein [Deltaproteobacteria bacterium]